MRRKIFAAVVVAVFALGLAGSLAWAAGAVAVDVPFSFLVKDKEMPAGSYEIRAEGANQSPLTIRSTRSGGTVVLQVIERLADTGAKEPKVVFDKVDNKYYLSEVHMPGTDGFLVGIAKGKETHEVLTGKE